jgi:hypothetical protein
MKSLIMALVTTFTAFLIIHAQEQEKKTATQTNAQMAKVVKETISNLPNELSTLEKREEAAKILQKIIDKRILTNARGYERCEAFQEEVRKTYARLSEYIKSDVSRLKPEEARKLSQTSMKAYTANAEEFNRFYTQNLRNDPAFKGMSEEQFIKLATQVSALLRGKNEDQWKTAFRVTFLWPVCATPPDNYLRCSIHK